MNPVRSLYQICRTTFRMKWDLQKLIEETNESLTKRISKEVTVTPNDESTFVFQVSSMFVEEFDRNLRKYLSDNLSCFSEDSLNHIRQKVFVKARPSIERYIDKVIKSYQKQHSSYKNN